MYPAMFLAAASNAAMGSSGLTPQPFAVSGMICAMPRAPAEDKAFGLKPDSVSI